MGKYIVTVTEKTTTEFVVDAKNAKEAEIKARLGRSKSSR